MNNASRSPFLGLSSYAWGGEQIQVDRFDVNRSFADQVFTITAIDRGKYTLYDESGQNWPGAVGILSTDDLKSLYHNWKLAMAHSLKWRNEAGSR